MFNPGGKERINITRYGREQKKAQDKKHREEVGKALKEARVATGVTQKKLADILGVNSKTLSAYENGRIMAPGNVLIKAAKLLGVEIDTLGHAADHSPLTPLRKLHRVPVLDGKTKYHSKEEFFLGKDPIAFGLVDVDKPEEYIFVTAADDDLSELNIKTGYHCLVRKMQKPSDKNVVACLIDGMPTIRQYEYLSDGRYLLKTGDFSNNDLIVENGKIGDLVVEYLGVVKLVQFASQKEVCP